MRLSTKPGSSSTYRFRTNEDHARVALLQYSGSFVNLLKVHNSKKLEPARAGPIDGSFVVTGPDIKSIFGHESPVLGSKDRRRPCANAVAFLRISSRLLAVRTLLGIMPASPSSISETIAPRYRIVVSKGSTAPLATRKSISLAMKVISWLSSSHIPMTARVVLESTIKAPQPFLLFLVPPETGWISSDPQALLR